jgi:putative transposase
MIISKERNMFVTENFLSDIVDKHGRQLVSTEECTWYPPQACRFLKLDHHLHSNYEKSIIERTIQYIKKIEPKNVLMIIFLAKKKKCNLKHVQQWFNLFAFRYNKELIYCLYRAWHRIITISLAN